LENLPFDTVSLAADDVQALEDTYKALKAKYNIGLPDANSHINKFELFNNEQEANVSGVFLIDYPATDCYLNFVKIRYQFTSGRSRMDYLKCQAWAFVNLKKDFGRILIRKETLTDKVLELVHHTELKFSDDKVFSSNFYVATNDTDKALATLTPDFRDVIKNNMYANFVIEIVKDTLVIRNNQPIDPEQTIELVELASKLAALK
jgi:hypothetical protein